MAGPRGPCDSDAARALPMVWSGQRRSFQDPGGMPPSGLGGVWRPERAASARIRTRAVTEAARSPAEPAARGRILCASKCRSHAPPRPRGLELSFPRKRSRHSCGSDVSPLVRAGEPRSLTASRELPSRAVRACPSGGRDWPAGGRFGQSTLHIRAIRVARRVHDAHACLSPRSSTCGRSSRRSSSAIA